jgi:acyl dehydratase
VSLSEGMLFEDYVEGDIIETPRRTVTDYEISSFVTLCGFLTPTFTDLEYVSRPEHYSGRIAPGLLTLSLAEGLILAAGLTRGTGLALLELTPKWESPVYSGDTIYTEINVKSKRLTSKKDRGVVVTENLVKNTKGTVVARYTSTRMIKTKLFGAEAESE